MNLQKEKKAEGTKDNWAKELLSLKRQVTNHAKQIETSKVEQLFRRKFDSDRLNLKLQPKPTFVKPVEEAPWVKDLELNKIGTP